MKTTSLVKSFTIKLISRKNSQVIQKFRKLHTVHYAVEITLTLALFRQKIREINFFAKEIPNIFGESAIAISTSQCRKTKKLI